MMFKRTINVLVFLLSQKINIYIDKIIELSQCCIYKLSGRIIGVDGDLVNKYIGAILGTMLNYLAKIIRYVCYPEYSSTIDGTPAMSKAE